MMAIVVLPTSVDLTQLAFQLVSELGDDQLIQFIKDLDECINDYEFTSELRDYFIGACGEE